MCYFHGTNFRLDDGRVILGLLGDRTCAVTINPIQNKDAGLWNITIESGFGKNQTEYTHNVSVTTQG